MSCFHSVTDESTTDAFSFAVSEDMFPATYNIMKQVYIKDTAWMV